MDYTFARNSYHALEKCEGVMKRDCRIRKHVYIYTQVRPWSDKYFDVQELFRKIVYEKIDVSKSMIYSTLRIPTPLGFTEHAYTHYIRLGFSVSIETTMVFKESLVKYVVEYGDDKKERIRTIVE